MTRVGLAALAALVLAPSLSGAQPLSSVQLRRQMMDNLERALGPAGLEACAVYSMVAQESGGDATIVGHDEDAGNCRPTLQSSHRKYSGQPYTGGSNDDGAHSNRHHADPSRRDLGLDWRFSHGLGLGQQTANLHHCTGAGSTLIATPPAVAPDVAVRLLDPARAISLLINGDPAMGDVNLRAAHSWALNHLGALPNTPDNVAMLMHNFWTARAVGNECSGKTACRTEAYFRCKSMGASAYKELIVSHGSQARTECGGANAARWWGCHCSQHGWTAHRDVGQVWTAALLASAPRTGRCDAGGASTKKAGTSKAKKPAGKPAKPSAAVKKSGSGGPAQPVANKSTAPAKKSTSAKKSAKRPPPAKKAPAKKAPAKKAPAKKAPAKKAPAKKASAKKAPAKKAPAEKSPPTE